MSDYWKDNNIEKPQAKIVCAACRTFVNGKEIIIAGARHFDRVMISQIEALDDDILESINDWESGFINQFGEFLDRYESMKVAKEANQPIDIERGCGGKDDMLFSEGLY